MSKRKPNFSKFLHILKSGAELVLIPLGEHKESILGIIHTVE